MKQILKEAMELARAGSPFTIVTAVRTVGSTPQKVGAKLLVRADGTIVGTIGGGCVEGDVWYNAKELMRRRGKPEVKAYDFDESKLASEVLLCGGTMHFFMDPVWDSSSLLPLLEQIDLAYRGGSWVAMATILESPEDRAKEGKKAILREENRIFDFVGEEEMDAEIARAAKKCGPHGECRMIAFPSGTKVFVEGFTSPPCLVILGGGHVGKAVYDLAVNLDFDTYVIDDRPQFANAERFPKAKAALVIEEFREPFQNIALGQNTFIVVATRGHSHDEVALKASLQTPARYIGMLGSRRKTSLIYRNLLESGVPIERLKQVKSPIGLDIGAVTPEELAISILAEIIMCRLGGSGKSLQMEVSKNME